MTSCVLVCILTGALAVAPAAAQPGPAQVTAYLSLLERYESGDYAGAANAVLTLDPDYARALARLVAEDVEDEIVRLRRMKASVAEAPTRGFLNRLRRERIRRLKLALLLHTEAALRLTAARPLAGQLEIARVWMARLRSLEEDFKVNGPLDSSENEPGVSDSDGPALSREQRAALGRPQWESLRLFVRDWYLVVVAHGQRVGHLGILKSLVTSGLELFKEDPELLLARGAISEGEADLAMVDRSLATEIYSPGFAERWRRFMSAAGEDYRLASRRQPDLDEATLRWGRINSHLGDHKEARRAFERVATGDAPALLRYLAQLFQGDLADREQRPDEARAAYEAASVLYPSAQAPLLSLSRLCDAAGDQTCARRWLTRSLAATKPGRVDPWWDYQRGQAWRLQERLSRFRARGLRP